MMPFLKLLTHAGVNASQTYNISGKSPNCKVGVDGYGVGKLYTTFVYKLKSGMYIEPFLQYLAYAIMNKVNFL